MADERQTRIEELKLRLRTNGDNPDVRAELAALETQQQQPAQPAPAAKKTGK